MKEKYMQVLFDLCATELSTELSDDSSYTEVRKEAYDIEMELRKEFSKEQMKKIEILVRETEKVSLAESECLFKMAFNLGINMVMNTRK